MRGISRGEIWILGLTAAFLLVMGGCFLLERNAQPPYEVTVEETAADKGEERSSPDSLLPGEKIDLNTADRYDLARLPGIGEKRAQAIIAYREEEGPFSCVDELVEVKGIGEGILANVRAYVTADAAE